MNSIQKLASMGCGSEIINSQIERGSIHAAISNCNTFIKYAKQCKKYYKETKEEHWLDSAHNSLLPYYNQLLSVQYLADKYHALYGEKYYKTKCFCEIILNK
jgi:hypothetical protein